MKLEIENQKGFEDLLKRWEAKAKENWSYNGDSEEENACASGVAQGYENCIDDLMNLLEGTK
jgi:hypothetical protein